MPTVDTYLPPKRLRDQIAHALANEACDPARDEARARVLIAEHVTSWNARGDELAVDEDACVRALADDFLGLGPLQPFLDDPTIEEIWIDSPTKIFIARDGKPQLTSLILSEDAVRDLVERMLRSTGRRLDLSAPFVDAMLPGGERLHVVIPPITRTHWSVNIRKHIAKARRVSDLVRLGMLGPQAAAFLSAAVAAGLNVVVSGATQAGKTTLLRALAGEIPAAQRIICCEEVFELDLANRDVVAMQTRPATMEGTGEIALRDLVKETLRMRPERIIIGEVRGAESLDMLIAMNAGVAGMSTLHANSARDALAKLTVLPLLAGPNVSSDFVIPTIASALDLVVHVTRDPDGRRRVSEILSVTGRCEGQTIEAADLFRDSGAGLERTHASLDAHERFAAAGFALDELLGA
ncbi:MAG: ATPase, T2SS/T4P/T4SS family [Actinomycetaceae bacterium]|nr:ATPase, T2SS/T4P/T4SS family [Actinomycetaceae bacterium]MDU0970197.1 ATPase, T2SS/T4P/T4SS family [Actinomycetaceae bacterium]